MQFTVENLGKVGKADIDLKPLTIFIGKNGSGKTYVASALWAFISHIKDKRNFKSLLSNDLYLEYKKEIDEKISNCKMGEMTFEIKAQDLQKIHDNLVKNLHHNSLDIIKNCFKYDFEQEIVFKFMQKQEFKTPFFAKIILEQIIIDEDDFSSHNKNFNTYKINFNKLTRRVGFPKSIKGIEFHITDLIIGELISYAFFGGNVRIFDSLMYIPAARTGLMFGLHNFAQQGLDNGLLNENELDYTNLLTAPLTDFIVQAHRFPLLNKLSRQSQNTDLDINNLLGGKISIDKSFRYKFIPNSLNKEIPLSATSSLVTEVSALAIFRHQVGKGSFVIFEEPEAHLHLSAQREMAKLIVKMINQGCHMLITTHSDTFLQQLNNLIMLNKLSENNPDILQEFNIEQDETIAGEKVSVYDFQYQNDDKTVAKLLELGDYGFIAPSVNDEINNLIRQTDSIIDMIDDLKSNGE